MRSKIVSICLFVLLMPYTANAEQDTSPKTNSIKIKSQQFQFVNSGGDSIVENGLLCHRLRRAPRKGHQR